MVAQLPEELLGLILEHLALPDTFTNSRLQQHWGNDSDCYRVYLMTLNNACLASKTLYRLAWPMLYRQFANHPLTVGAFHPHNLDPVRFLQTICRRPEYGLTLRTLSIDSWDAVEAMDAAQVFDLLQGDATLDALFNWRARGFWLGQDVEPGKKYGAAGSPHGNAAAVVPAHQRAQPLEPPAMQFSLVVRLLSTTLSDDYRMLDPPTPVYDFEQDESDYQLAQMFETSWHRPELRKSAMLRNLQKCTLRGSGMPLPCQLFRNILELPQLQDLMIGPLQGDSKGTISDFRVNVPCTQLKKLQIADCRFRTCEIISVVQCCPNLVDLSIHWDLRADGVENNDHPKYYLLYGHIGDAIAKYAPRLESLKISSHRWPFRNPELEYPHTMGKALQPLGHLQDLSLDHCVIYGDEDGGVSQCSLGDVVPKSVSKLHIGHSILYYGTAGAGEEFKDSWKDWQIDDLNHFLQDGSFKRLRVVELDLGALGSERHIDPATVSQHGWEFTEENDWYCTIENRGRPESCRK
ncbi:hypothetical protein E2P81_ATG10256 [Venturia nashicola]|nr:hypothetical protein E2P81_ATG10256 [Venturia nashicola]